MKSKINTIIQGISLYCEDFKKTHDIDMTIQFVSCATTQLTAYFEKHTGVKIGKLIDLMAPSGKIPGYPLEYFYTKGPVSKYNVNKPYGSIVGLKRLPSTIN